MNIIHPNTDKHPPQPKQACSISRNMKKTCRLQDGQEINFNRCDLLLHYPFCCRSALRAGRRVSPSSNGAQSVPSATDMSAPNVSVRSVIVSSNISSSYYCERYADSPVCDSYRDGKLLRSWYVKTLIWVQ